MIEQHVLFWGAPREERGNIIFAAAEDYEDDAGEGDDDDSDEVMEEGEGGECAAPPATNAQGKRGRILQDEMYDEHEKPGKCRRRD